jgi:hypothetical protein
MVGDALISIAAPLRLRVRRTEAANGLRLARLQ